MRPAAPRPTSRAAAGGLPTCPGPAPAQAPPRHTQHFSPPPNERCPLVASCHADWLSDAYPSLQVLAAPPARCATPTHRNGKRHPQRAARRGHAAVRPCGRARAALASRRAALQPSHFESHANALPPARRPAQHCCPPPSRDRRAPGCKTGHGCCTTAACASPPLIHPTPGRPGGRARWFRRRQQQPLPSPSDLTGALPAPRA